MSVGVATDDHEQYAWGEATFDPFFATVNVDGTLPSVSYGWRPPSFVSHDLDFRVRVMKP